MVRLNELFMKQNITVISFSKYRLFEKKKGVPLLEHEWCGVLNEYYTRKDSDELKNNSESFET